MKHFVPLIVSLFIALSLASVVRADDTQPLVQYQNEASNQTDLSHLSVEERVTRLERLMAAQSSLQLLNRLNDLQQQIEILQGQNEVLRHQLQQVQKTQRKMYAALDERISALESGKKLKKPTSFSFSTPVSSGDDQAAYQKAYQLIAQRDYDQAITSLQAFIKQYPKSQYVPNAYYWQGEVLAAQGKNVKAMTVFNQLIKQFPDSNKVPDASLKIAMILQSQGDIEQAKQQLQAVVNQYANSSAANLAQIQLRQLKQSS